MKKLVLLAFCCMVQIPCMLNSMDKEASDNICKLSDAAVLVLMEYHLKSRLILSVHGNCTPIDHGYIYRKSMSDCIQFIEFPPANGCPTPIGILLQHHIDHASKTITIDSFLPRICNIDTYRSIKKEASNYWDIPEALILTRLPFNGVDIKNH